MQEVFEPKTILRYASNCLAKRPTTRFKEPRLKPVLPWGLVWCHLLECLLHILFDYFLSDGRTWVEAVVGPCWVADCR